MKLKITYGYGTYGYGFSSEDVNTLNEFKRLSDSAIQFLLDINDISHGMLMFYGI